MTFLIDGYNLMYAVGLASRAMPAPRFERARAKFLDWLADGAKERAVLRVIFDAQEAPARSGEIAYRGVRVQFAYRQTADDFIETLLAVQERPAVLTVVSNDGRVREAARRAGCAVASNEEFTDWLIAGTPLREPGEPAPPEPDKPEPTADEVAELLPLFSQPKPRR